MQIVHHKLTRQADLLSSVVTMPACMHSTRWSMLIQYQALIPSPCCSSQPHPGARRQAEACLLLAGQLLGAPALDYPIHCHGSQRAKGALQDPACECADCGAHVQQGNSLRCAPVTVLYSGASNCHDKLQAVPTGSLYCYALGGFKTLARYIRAAPSEWVVKAGADCLG